MSTIADLHRKKKQIVVPVFYHVPSSNVRRQAGPYLDHFNLQQSRYPEETINKWKTDMTYLSNVYGFDIVDSNGQEPNHLERIIGDVAKKLNHSFTLITSDLIGIQPRVAELERSC
ncbi:disease resistance protein Roq1-like [Arachis duranensis]|uniref:Disease resistance protein Roq1-like n=1 Tax=Arachis duranensis TaxID=130453 RepID=A0A9C6TIC4_ARADU|nr:disease resistance protein Roq1-like [Arachis duranensis]